MTHVEEYVANIASDFISGPHTEFLERMCWIDMGKPNWDKALRARRQRERRKYPLLEDNNQHPILVMPFMVHRPIKLSSGVPLMMRKLAWKIRRHPKLARTLGYHLIFEDGRMAGR